MDNKSLRPLYLSIIYHATQPKTNPIPPQPKTQNRHPSAPKPPNSHTSPRRPPPPSPRNHRGKGEKKIKTTLDEEGSEDGRQPYGTISRTTEKILQRRPTPVRDHRGPE